MEGIRFFAALRMTTDALTAKAEVFRMMAAALSMETAGY